MAASDAGTMQVASLQTPQQCHIFESRSQTILVAMCPNCLDDIPITARRFPGFVFDEVMIHLAMDCLAIEWRSVQADVADRGCRGTC